MDGRRGVYSNSLMNGLHHSLLSSTSRPVGNLIQSLGRSVHKTLGKGHHTFEFPMEGDFLALSIACSVTQSLSKTLQSSLCLPEHLPSS